MKYFVIVLAILLAGCNASVRNANAVDRLHSSMKSACKWDTFRYTVSELDNNITYTITCVREQ